MILIFGGAWQGKTAFARQHWQLNQQEIYYCTRKDGAFGPQTPSSCLPQKGEVRCISGLHEALLGRVRSTLKAAGVPGVPEPEQQDNAAFCTLPAGEDGLDLSAAASAECLAWLQEQLPGWENMILICDDISAGVVPLGADVRCWREAVGRCLAMLAARSDEVYRVFCGLETKLK